MTDISFAQTGNLQYMMAFYNNPTGILEAQIAHCHSRHSHLSDTLNQAYGAWRQRNDPYIPLVRQRMLNEFRKQRQNLQQILLNLRRVEQQAQIEFERQVALQGDPVCANVATELDSTRMDFAPLFR